MLKIIIEENTSSHEILKKGLNDLNIKEYEIKKNKYGYPYLSNINNLYFNISNKDNVSICVFSDVPIGVDIEKPVYREKMLKRYFTFDEIKHLNNSNNKEYDFMKMWIIKEGYVKSLGIGINYGLNKVNSLKLEKNTIIKKYKNYYYAVYKNYAI